MAVRLRCLDREFRDDLWRLHFDWDRGRVVLRDEDGVTLCRLTSEQALERFQMPSFTDGINYFGIMLDGHIYQFEVSRTDLREIQDFLNQSIANQGFEAMEEIKNRAVFQLCLGLACVVGGILLTIVSYFAAVNNPEGGTYFVTYGVVIFGLALTGKGIYGLIQYDQIQRLS